MLFCDAAARALWVRKQSAWVRFRLSLLPAGDLLLLMTGPRRSALRARRRAGPVNYTTRQPARGPTPHGRMAMNIRKQTKRQHYVRRTVDRAPRAGGTIRPSQYARDSSEGPLAWREARLGRPPPPSLSTVDFRPTTQSVSMGKTKSKMIRGVTGGQPTGSGASVGTAETPR